MNTQTQLGEWDRNLIRHYIHFQGNYHGLFKFADGDEKAPRPIYVLEFSPSSQEYDWLYITSGMSRKPMFMGNDQHRVELIMYSRTQQIELTNTLAKLAMYPFVHETNFAAGHTIAGKPGDGIVTGSPLTDILLTPVYFEAEGFDYVPNVDGTHTHILWATPIYQSELSYIKQHGWRMLIEDLFTKHEVQPADLWRPPVI